MLFDSCGKEKYKIDYCGLKDCFKGAKDSYRQGQTVTIYYNLIATDTDYSFYLDGEFLNVEYSEKNGFEIRFVMPSHDVKLECRSYNSMEYNGLDGTETENSENLLVDYYYAVTGTEESRGYTEMALYSKSNNEATLKVFKKNSSDDEENVTEYTVPYEAVEKCLETAKKYKFDRWSKLKDTYPIDGSITVVKYYNGSQYIRVSTEEMPEGGEKQLDEIAAVMRSFIK